MVIVTFKRLIIYLSFQIHISDRNEIEILVNGDNVEFNEQLMIAFNKVTVLKYNNTAKYSTIFESGISVTIEQIEEILQMMLLLPPVFKGMINYFMLSVLTKFHNFSSRQS